MLALWSRPQTCLFVHVLKENVINRNGLDGFMIDQEQPTIWQSSPAPDSQMFVLWKEVLIRVSHPGERTRGSRGHGGHLKMRKREKKDQG